MAKERFYGIETNPRAGFGSCNDDVVMHGPFKSVTALKKHLLVEAGFPDVRKNDLEAGDNDDWGSDVILVKEIETVRVVPQVQVHMRLKTTNAHPVGESTHTDEKKPEGDDEA